MGKDKLSKEIRTKLSKIDGIESRLKEIDDSINRISSNFEIKYEKLNKENKDLLTAKTDIEGKKSQLEVQLTNTSKKNDELNIEIVKLKNEIAKLNSELKNNEKEINIIKDTYKSELSKIKDTYKSELSQINDRYKNELSQINDSHKNELLAIKKNGEGKESEFKGKLTISENYINYLKTADKYNETLGILTEIRKVGTQDFDTLSKNIGLKSGIEYEGYNCFQIISVSKLDILNYICNEMKKIKMSSKIEMQKTEKNFYVYLKENIPSDKEFYIPELTDNYQENSGWLSEIDDSRNEMKRKIIKIYSPGIKKKAYAIVKGE